MPSEVLSYPREARSVPSDIYIPENRGDTKPTNLEILPPPREARSAPIDIYIPESWDQKKTRNLAVDMLARFVNRNELFGPERVIGVSNREREALLRILAHCKWTILSRKPDATYPDRKHTLLAFRSGKIGKALQNEVLVSPSGNDLDFVLMPVDRKQKDDAPPSHNYLTADRKQLSDRLYVTLETGHNIAMPLTGQKVKKLKKIRDDLQKAADDVLERHGAIYISVPYQQRLQGLADAFDTLIEGIKNRADAPKPHKSKNQMSKIRRHSNSKNAQDEVVENTCIAHNMGLAHRNRIAAERSRAEQKEKAKRARKSRQQRRSYVKNLVVTSHL